jgi:UDP-4-amino-4-deoxy-L-arabinose-oxoglutarate aminotransferase
MIAEGALVDEFEHAVSRYLAMLGGVATSSGTSALFLALKASGIKAGDEVIIPTYVCRSVWDAVSETGARPVLCDIGDDWCMNTDTIKPRITARTKALIVVHTFGIMADIEPICDLGIPVIEDCCQALGTRNRGKMAGLFGAACVLSFHATKLLTTGEGGMVLTDDAQLLKKIKELKHGEADRLILRYRQPMSDLQAALGLSQLAQYDDFLNRRRFITEYYFTHLKDLPIGLPDLIRGKSIFFRFPVRTRHDFDKLRTLFDAEGIQVRRGVDALLHRKIEGILTGFPTAEKIFSETLSLPIYPAMSEEDCERVMTACHDIFKDANKDSRKV